MIDVISLGEALIDFVPTESGVNLAGVPGFYKRFGGAPANVAIGLAQIGRSPGFIGKVGRDSFGDFLESEMAREGVNVDHLYRSDLAHTTLAFVSLTSEGERDFIFYRNPGADELLRPEEIDENYLSRARVLHFGSLSLTKEESREATIQAIEYAQENGLTVSLDPNVRLDLWDDTEKLRRMVRDLLEDVDIIKLSEEEVEFFTGLEDLRAGMIRLSELGPDLVVVTLGDRGCKFYYEGVTNKIDGFDVDVKDTTGAGDGFLAGFFASLLNQGADLSVLELEPLEKALKFGNATGALTTTDYGATSSFPSLTEVKEFLRHRN